MTIHRASKANYFSVKCDYFLIHQFKHVFGAQKKHLTETVLLSTHNMFWLRNKKNNFQLCTLIWGPAYILYSEIIDIRTDS